MNVGKAVADSIAPPVLREAMRSDSASLRAMGSAGIVSNVGFWAASAVGAVVAGALILSLVTGKPTQPTERPGDEGWGRETGGYQPPQQDPAEPEPRRSPRVYSPRTAAAVNLGTAAGGAIGGTLIGAGVAAAKGARMAPHIKAGAWYGLLAGTLAGLVAMNPAKATSDQPVR